MNYSGINGLINDIKIYCIKNNQVSSGESDQNNFKKIFFLKFKKLLAAPGLHCCLQTFSGFDKWASPGGGFPCCRVWALGHAGPVVMAFRLSCSAARGIFLDQGSNPCALYWQADSYPLHHQGSLPVIS